MGVALLGAAFGWLLLGLWRSPRPTPVVLSAGAALTALAVLASVGNALSFAPVTAGAGLLAGLATARAAGEGTIGAGAQGVRHTGAAADSRMFQHGLRRRTVRLIRTVSGRG